MARRIVVIGSGAAGLTAASKAREHDRDAEITVVTEEEHIAYSPCAIPFVIEGTIPDFQSIVMHTPEFYMRERSIAIKTRTKALSVDIDARKVRTSASEELTYDSLVLCPGGNVFVPPVEGVKLSGVFPVRGIADGEAIESALASVKQVVVAGAGVIGLEMAVALSKRGKKVTVVEMFPQVVPRLLDPDMASMVQSYCSKLGIEFLLNSPISIIKGNDRVSDVLAGNREIPCQIVIMATGVRANLELPNQIGLDIGPLGAVRVSPTMQPYKKGRLVKDLYMAGDAVMCRSAATPGPTMNQLGSAAVRQGRVAGINAAGGHATYPEVASPWVSYLGELQFAGTGLSQVLAEYYGLRVAEGKATGSTRARYYPGGKEITVKMIAGKDTRRIIGAQIVGGEEVTGRINWITGAILKGVTVDEFVASFENAYCPPTSMVVDVVNSAAESLLNNMSG